MFVGIIDSLLRVLCQFQLLLHVNLEQVRLEVGFELILFDVELGPRDLDIGESNLHNDMVVSLAESKLRNYHPGIINE